MATLSPLEEFVRRVAETGKKTRGVFWMRDVEPFRHYFSPDGTLKYGELDEFDGKWTRREILARCLLVSIVLDQGPDMTGVRELLKTVTEQLYRREVRILHRPLDFFKELGISIDAILEEHQSVKKLRGEYWAKENESSANKYNLFFAQSPRGIISTKQVLDYALHRWGVPLCVPLLLEKDLEKRGQESPQPLVDYLEGFPSAEIMATELKGNERYGLEAGE